MNAYVRELSTGTIKILIYVPQQIPVKITKGFIYDIYHNIPDFNTKIVWLTKATPKDGHTLEELMTEYINTYIGNKTMFVTQAGTLHILNYIPAGDVEDGMKLIDEEKKKLLDLGFVNPIFTKKMRESKGNVDICIYTNEGGNNFINTYSEEPMVLINRVNRVKNEETQ